MYKKHIFSTLIIAWLCGWCSIGAQAQCTTFAGTITPQNLTICKNANTLQAAPATGAVLDADDIAAYVIHQGTATQLGAIVSTGTAAGVFTAPFPAAGTYTISAVAGSRIPGSVLINYNDPCLSVVYAGTLTIDEVPGITINSTGVLSCASPTVTLYATLAGSFGNFTTAWTGPGIVNTVGLNVEVNAPGIYTIQVTTDAGCVATASATAVNNPNTPSMAVWQDNPDPCASNPATQILRCSLFTTILPQSYEWSTGETTATIEVPNVPPSGFAYCVTVTLANGCAITDCIVPTLSSGFNVGIDVFNFCDSNEVYLTLNNQYAGATFQWSTGNQQPGAPPGIVVTEAGYYAVTVTLPQGCSAVASIFLEASDACSVLEGRVVGDLDSNCSESAGDVNLGGITLEITNLNDLSTSFVVTNTDGTWSKGVPVGNYSIVVHPPNGVWTPCIQTQVVATTGFDTTQVAAFFLQPVENCPRLEVDLATPWLRRCFDGTYHVNYCNTGTETATGAYVDLALDPFLSFGSASLPETNLGNNTYRFQLGDVAIGACGSFSVTAAVSCNAVLGQTHCTEATVYPNAPCGENLGNWSGASLQITAECDGDSLRFTLENVGIAPMTNPLQYVVIEDVVMMKSVPPPTIMLSNGQSIVETVPANGATWYVAAQQEPNHPGNSFPSLSVEGCTTGASFSTGYVNAFPQNDADYWIDIDCTPNVGSFDPNDKQAFPVGYGAQHQIGRNTEIEYLIRFQNTGTDTAFTVVIRDTLSAFLDPLTVRPGASSHAYTFNYFGEGSNMKFVFDNIHLPDSSKSQEGSKGFISYRVSPKAGLPFGSVINNNAGIYFDYNAPIITNTTHHLVDTNFVLVASWEAFWQGATLSISPNPMRDRAVLTLDGLPENTEVRIEILDMLGRVQESGSTSNGQWSVYRNQLTAGTYWVKTSANGRAIGIGKLVVQ